MRPPLIWLWRLLLGGFAVVYLASSTLQLWLRRTLLRLAALPNVDSYVATALVGKAGPTPDQLWHTQSPTTPLQRSFFQAALTERRRAAYAEENSAMDGSARPQDARRLDLKLIIDLVIQAILLALGMMMMSPMTISLPFKLLLFVTAGGWTKLVNALVLSYTPA